MISNASVQRNSNLSSCPSKSTYSVSGNPNTQYIGLRKVPQILALAASRVEQWSEHSYKWLIKLRVAILERVASGKRLSTRTMRKDQRDAITALLRVMLSYLDLKTMQIGVYHPQTGVFAHLTLEYLANKAELSLSQAQRAMAWLYEGGYVVGFRQSSFDLDTGELIYKPSIRRISNHLLTDLGITELAFSKARTKSKKSAIKEAAISVVKNTRTKIKNAFSNVIKKIPMDAPKKIGMALEEYAEKLAKLMEAIPDKSLEEVQRMLPRPTS